MLPQQKTASQAHRNISTDAGALYGFNIVVRNDADRIQRAIVLFFERRGGRRPIRADFTLYPPNRVVFDFSRMANIPASPTATKLQLELNDPVLTVQELDAGNTARRSYSNANVMYDWIHILNADVLPSLQPLPSTMASLMQRVDAIAALLP
jgi:hypothetical protein